LFATAASRRTRSGDGGRTTSRISSTLTSSRNPSARSSLSSAFIGANGVTYCACGIIPPTQIDGSESPVPP